MCKIHFIWENENMNMKGHVAMRCYVGLLYTFSIIAERWIFWLSWCIGIPSVHVWMNVHQHFDFYVYTVNMFNIQHFFNVIPFLPIHHTIDYIIYNINTISLNQFEIKCLQLLTTYQMF